MSILNGKTTKVTEFNTCPTTKFNTTLLTLLEEESGLVITKVTVRDLAFRYIKYSKFRFAKRNFRHCKPSLIQQKKGVRQYKKTVYLRTKGNITAIKQRKLNRSDTVRLFAVRV